MQSKWLVKIDLSTADGEPVNVKNNLGPSPFHGPGQSSHYFKYTCILLAQEKS